MSSFSYCWYLSAGYPAAGVVPHGKRVFSTFACGGGSTMGYKLAGYQVIGCNEIDPQMMAIYRANHHPQLAYQEDIRTLVQRDDLPLELYQLDILDGSPPCSVFSTTGEREKAWGKEKVFREGQARQQLDDLFAHFIQLAEKLQPKVIIAENVKGMLVGHAKGYVLEIQNQLATAGYTLQVFLLNAATMGVPQIRERVFFIARRNDLYLPPLMLSFSEPAIPFHQISRRAAPLNGPVRPLSKLAQAYWSQAKEGKAVGRFKSDKKLSRSDPCFTIRASARHYHYAQPRKLSDAEVMLCGSFPLDFNFLDTDVNYVVGMSVPPVMMAQIADQVYIQWLSHLNSES